MNIIVNGGSRGIGREVALYLSQDASNKVVVTGRNRQALDDIAAGRENLYPEVIDLTAGKELSASFQGKIASHFTGADVLINMAGALIAEEFMKIDERDARMMMETNFFGPATLIRILKPIMNEGSHILNISSMGGFQGSVKYSGLSYYSASKAAIACLSECLAVEFRESGVSVNCIALGSVQTEMLAEAFPGYRAPLGADEIAPFISYLALNAHLYMNGRIIPVAVNNP